MADYLIYLQVQQKLIWTSQFNLYLIIDLQVTQKITFVCNFKRGGKKSAYNKGYKIEIILKTFVYLMTVLQTPLCCTNYYVLVIVVLDSHVDR